MGRDTPQPGRGKSAAALTLFVLLSGIIVVRPAVNREGAGAIPA